MKTLYIIRGLPGSGKSTLAAKMAKELNAFHYEADMYFMRDGVYVFEGNRIPAAHEWCFRQVEDCMFNDADVIVSNTFTRWFEIEEYIETAMRADYAVKIIHCTGKWKSVHDISEKILQKMADRWWPNELLPLSFFKNIETSCV